MTTDELRRLLDEATPRPWGQSVSGWYIDAAGGVAIADVHGISDQALSNAALIAAAVNALPALLAVVEAAQEFRDEYAGYDDGAEARRKLFDALDALDKAKP
jgi:hypothetical protein